MALEIDRPNSPSKRITGYQTVWVKAPEAQGVFDIANVDPPEVRDRLGHVGDSSYTYFFGIRAPKDFEGKGSVDVTWRRREGGPVERVTIYFGNGWKSSPDTQVSEWFKVYFMRERFKANYLIPAEKVKLAKDTLGRPLVWGMSYTTTLSIKDFERTFDPLAREIR